MEIEIKTDNNTGINDDDLIYAIHDYLLDLINDNIDLNGQYENIDFKYNNNFSTQAYISGFDGETEEFLVNITSLTSSEESISASFVAYSNIALHYSISIDAHDWADGGYFSVGETEKTFEEEIEVNGSFTIGTDLNDFKGTINPIDYPDIDTDIDVLEEIFDEPESYGEASYLMDFIQDDTFSAISILNDQLSTLEKLLAISEDSHAINTIIHASAIGSLESYLSKKLIPLIANDRYLNIQKAYANQMCSTEQKIFSISDIVNNQLTSSKVLRNTLIRKSFHDVGFVSNLLKKVFSLDISSESKDWLSHAVEIRHDCVHRSGYDQSHKRVPINKESNYTLIEKVKLLTQRLESELPEKIKEKYDYDMPPQELTVIAEGNNK